MQITGDMTINDVLAIDEDKMIKTLSWLVPELARLQSPRPQRAVVGGVTIEQAARIARIPLVEVLYVLNLASGRSDESLMKELVAEYQANRDLT